MLGCRGLRGLVAAARVVTLAPLPPPPTQTQVGGSFGLFYGYVGVIGLAIYLVLRWFKAGVSLASVWCIYGAPAGRGAGEWRRGGSARSGGKRLAWGHVVSRPAPVHVLRFLCRPL